MFSVALSFPAYVFQVEPRLLWSRISERLRQQPERAKYNEGSREWMEKTVSFYESMCKEWLILENNENTLQECMDDLLLKLSSSVSTFKCPSPPPSPADRMVVVSSM